MELRTLSEPVQLEVAPGSRVAHYEIVSEVGRGGMGVVFRARDTTLRRVTALKTPLTDEVKHQRRFFREARAVARLSHPNIIPIYEVFEEAGRPWLAMEFVEGSNLATLISHGVPLPVKDVLRHAQGLAEALHCAHSNQLLHRDITPRNILVAADGRARLTDFGLAHALDAVADSSGSTASSSEVNGPRFGGTPGYMSPEQILGAPQDVRSDLFSLGVVLYEMCTGARAFPSSDRAGQFDAILHKQPVAIQGLNREVPSELERIITKAMAKLVDERYQSAQDLVADLKALRRHVDAGTTQEDYREVPPWRRWRVLSFPLAGLGILGILAGWLLLRSLAPPLPKSSPGQITSAPGWEAEPALSPDGSLIAYASDEAGQPDIWLVDSHGGSTLRLTDDPAADRSPSWFPDGTAVAFVSERGGRAGVWKVSRLGGSAMALVADAVDPAVSPDGRRIAFARPGPQGERIFVATLGDPESARRITSDGDGLWEHRHPAWSPDGKTLCYSGHRDLWIVPSTGGPARRLTSDDEVDVECVWSPSGRHVYFSSYREGTLALWRVPSGGGPAERVTLGGGPEVHPSLSTDGRRLAYSTFLQNDDVVLRELPTRREQRIGGLRDEFSPVFCPDQRALVFNSNRLGGRFDLWLQVISPDGALGAARRLTDHPGSVSHPTCSPDGRWVAYHRVLAGQRDIWVAPTEGGVAAQFTSDPAVDIHPDWSPDGSRLAFASERIGGSHIWVQPIAQGRPAGAARQLTTGAGVDTAPAWSPDGKAIAFIGMMGDWADVWIVPADGGGAARRVTQGAAAERVRWERSSGLLIVSGKWGEEDISLRRVRPADGRDGEPIPGILLRREAYSDFDASPDGKWLAFSREERRGDLWLLKAQEGSY